MKKYWNKTIYDKKTNQIKQGQEFLILENVFGYEKIGFVTRWKDGRLNDDEYEPAVEFQDAHVEHYKNGLLHNELKDEEGNLKPAIVANYGNDVEFWLNGNQVK